MTGPAYELFINFIYYNISMIAMCILFCTYYFIILYVHHILVAAIFQNLSASEALPPLPPNPLSFPKPSHQAKVK